MRNVGSSIFLLRNQQHLTQETLSRLCGVSRPNLSAIEQGARDITVGTLRRIASALGVSAGALVDGIFSDDGSKKLDRYSVDRIARLAAGQKLKASRQEKRIAGDLRSILKFKTNSGKLNRSRNENATIFGLKTELGPDMFEHLLKRIDKNLARPFTDE